jgi:flagellar biosynthetic protein FliR
VNALVFGFGGIEAEFWRLAFAMTRIGAALLAAPLFGAIAVPAQVRVIAAAAIGVLVCAWTPLAAPPALFSLPGMLAVAGFVLQLSFAAATIAAEVIGGAMGMGIATAVDPNSGAHSPAFGQYFSVVLTTVFLGLGGHLAWLALVIESYTAFPPGAAWLGAERFAEIAGYAGDMFTAAIVIALPVTLVLVLVQVATGVLSRSAPALNLFALGLPAGVLAGIAALIVAAPLAAEQFGALSGEAIERVAALLR